MIQGLDGDLAELVAYAARSARECINTSALIAAAARRLGMQAQVMATDCTVTRVDGIQSGMAVSHEVPEATTVHEKVFGVGWRGTWSPS